MTAVGADAVLVDRRAVTFFRTYWPVSGDDLYCLATGAGKRWCILRFK